MAVQWLLRTGIAICGGTPMPLSTLQSCRNALDDITLLRIQSEMTASERADVLQDVAAQAVALTSEGCDCSDMTQWRMFGGWCDRF